MQNGCRVCRLLVVYSSQFKHEAECFECKRVLRPQPQLNKLSSTKKSSIRPPPRKKKSAKTSVYRPDTPESLSGASSSRIRDPGSNQTESDNDGADEEDAQNDSAISETDSDDNKPLRRPITSSSKNSLNRLDRDRGRKRKTIDRNDRQNRRERKANRAANRKLRKRKEINFAEIDKNDESSGDDSDESYICTNCKKKRYSCNWVQCSSCKIWFCAKCVPNVKRYIHDIELVFNCEKCSKSLSKLTKSTKK